MTEKSIIFGFFGTVCDPVVSAWLGKHFLTSVIHDIQDEVISQADLGRVSFDEVLTYLAQKSGIHAATIRREFYELAKVRKDMVQLMEEIHRKYDVYLATNTIEEFFYGITDVKTACMWCKEVYISSKLGFSKPDPRFYNYILNDNGLLPGDVIYIDASYMDIEAATRLGLQTIKFTQWMNLREELKALGIEL